MKDEKYKKYAELAKTRKKVIAKPLNLSGPEGRSFVMEHAKRVIATHGDVIKALAKR